MTQTYFTVLTDIGAAALANSIALGREISISTFAVGDGGGPTYDPTVEELKSSTDLINKRYSGDIHQLHPDPDSPDRFFIEGVVPIDVGGWTVREAGWYLQNGDLFAITKFPASYKTLPTDGAATELPIRTYLATGAVENIQLKIDPTVVFATRSYVEQYQKIHVIDVAISFRCLNVFNAFGDIKLPVAKDGEWFVAKVDHSVSLSAGECAFVAPDGEHIKVMNRGDVEDHDRINIVQKGAEFRFYRINGGWRV